jgi:hypothetical protein
MKNLWPEDIESMVPARMPITILKEQGLLLGKMTKNVVEGEVQRYPQKSKELEFRFFVWAPSMNYRYPVLTILHDIEGYPVSIAPDSETKRELGLSPEDMIEAKDEAAFADWLKKIFNSEKVKRVIVALLAHAKEDPGPF